MNGDPWLFHVLHRAARRRVLPTLAACLTLVAWSIQSDAAPQQPVPGSPARDNRQPPSQSGSAVIRGRIVSAETGRPLRRVRITLSAAALGRDGRTTSTSIDGRYEVKDLPAGRYIVRVARNGYLGLQYGQRRPLEQGKPLQITEKQVVENIDFALPRASVIRGQITDELAEPVAGVVVFAMRMSYWQGRRRLVPVGGGPATQTDDAGEYRIANLAPGTYFVMARLRDTWTTSENDVTQTMGYAPTYFPGTSNLADARRVVVGVGEAATAVDFQLIPGRTSTVAGTAVDSLGRPLINRNIALVQTLVGPAFGMLVTGGSATSAADGSFTIDSVPPGEYKLQAQTTRETQTVQGTVLEVATVPITLDGADVTNLSLTTSMGWMASGRLTAETGGPPDAPRDRFGLVARLIDSAAAPFGGAPPPPPPPGGSGVIADSGRVKEDWTFAVTPIFGAARLRVSVPDGWGVKAILQNGRDISDDVLEMKSGEELAGLQVIVTDRVTTVSGQLVDDKGAAQSNGTVIVFADPAEKWSEDSRWVRAVRPDQQGRYQIKGLPPGDYLAIALDYVEDGIWNDPEYLDSIRPEARKLKLLENEAQIISLKVATLP
jgi:protocatechuate 3,4-dioxygenase beta subunit